MTWEWILWRKHYIKNNVKNVLFLFIYVYITEKCVLYVNSRVKPMGLHMKPMGYYLWWHFFHMCSICCNMCQHVDMQYMWSHISHVAFPTCAKCVRLRQAWPYCCTVILLYCYTVILWYCYSTGEVCEARQPATWKKGPPSLYWDQGQTIESQFSIFKGPVAWRLPQ